MIERVLNFISALFGTLKLELRRRLAPICVLALHGIARRHGAPPGDFGTLHAANACAFLFYQV
jgi:hypothetical protein